MKRSRSEGTDRPDSEIPAKSAGNSCQACQSPTGQRKLDDRLLRLMARELHLSRVDLLRFVECEMSYEDYLRRMIDEGHLRA